MNDLKTLDIDFSGLDANSAESHSTAGAKGMPEMSASCECGCHQSCEIEPVPVLPPVPIDPQ